MGIPGEDLPGSWPATEFVAWYNGHPDFQELVVRPLRRARGRGRGRQRRDRRRPDARARAGGDPADRHDRRGDRGDPRLRPEGDRPARPPRAGAGRVHDARAEGARRARRRRRARRPGRPRARPGERGRARARTRTRAATSRCCASTPPARRPGAEGDPPALLRLAGRDPRRGARRGRSRSSATGSSPTTRGACRRVPTDEHETIPCGIVFRSVGYHGVELPGVPFDEAGRDPERGRPGDRRRRRLLRRLDQARPERRDRDEQEGRDRDGRAAARGRPRRASSAAATRPRPPRRSTSCSPRVASRPSPTPAGRRSTSSSGRPASRTAGRASSSRRWDELCARRPEGLTRGARAAGPEASSHPFEGHEPSPEGRFLLHGDSPSPGGVPQLRLPPGRPRGRAALRPRRVPEVPLRGLGRER